MVEQNESAEGAWLEPRRPPRRRFTFLERAGELLEGTAHAGPSQEDWGPRKPATSAEDKGAADARKKIVKSAAKALYEGWEATFSATMSAGKVDLDIQLTKSMGGFKALITGKGYIQDFNFAGNIDVNAGALERLRMMSRNVVGRMDFTWESSRWSRPRLVDRRVLQPAAWA